MYIDSRPLGFEHKLKFMCIKFKILKIHKLNSCEINLNTGYFQDEYIKKYYLLHKLYYIIKLLLLI